MVQLGTEAFMLHVTQTAIVESKQVIWEYDPHTAQSAINGGLDLIAVIYTLAVKVSVWISLDCV